MTNTGLAHRADRVDYRSIWLGELRAGKHGQRLDRPATWRLDGLWSAACFQAQAEDAERLLADLLGRCTPFTRRRTDDMPEIDNVAGTLEGIEHAWNEAHASIIENTSRADRDALERARRLEADKRGVRYVPRMYTIGDARAKLAADARLPKVALPAAPTKRQQRRERGVREIRIDSALHLARCP